MVTVQWLAVYMCKRLLQLMTAEALTLARRRLPRWCVDCYLSYQNHFSLKDLIDSSLQSLKDPTKVSTVPTKLVCFTRSTPDIHRLSTVYCSGMSGYTTDEHNKLIKKMVHEDVRLMRDEMMCAVTVSYTHLTLPTKA